MDWEDVYAYLVDADGNEIFGAKPGIKMLREGVSLWYFINVPADFEYTVVFSDGSNNKSEKFTVSDDENVYFTADSQYASRAEAEALFAKDVVSEEIIEADENSKGISAAGVIEGSAAAVAAVGIGAGAVRFI